jgi:long-chain acyl-CoA synthetase
MAAMLYERWQQVAQTHAHEFALIESWSGRRWTFAALAQIAETAPFLTDSIIFPSGRSHEFILTVLAAWRSGAVCCPLEEGQASPPIPALPQTCVHLKLTSGSTGQPRLIGFTEEQLAADPANIVSTMGLKSAWPNLGVISLAHSYGFSNLVLPLLLHGIPLILVDTPLPTSVLNAAKLAPEITLAAVPALWRTWLDAKSIPANIRLAISAGAPLTLQLENDVFTQTGLKIHNFYGSSECGGIAYDRSKVPRQQANLAGSAMDNVRLMTNTEGCLEVHSAAVGLGSYPPEAERLGAGRFVTSDMVDLRDNQVSLLGRASDVINVAGRKVSPEGIENALSAHPAVLCCVAFGVTSEDPSRGENIVAMLRLREAVPTETLRQHLLALLPAWQIPREWVFNDELAPNHRGKISRRELRQKWLAQK